MSELPLSLKRTRFAQLGPLTRISFGIILSFASASLFAWLIVCFLSALI
jgi:hypothetical protein